ncbi:MAG: hypothetical protein JW716_02625 [Candidatus Aenigmarchaeota archaeon]|nr:hypothetical protein [Candidatus Aenigmarchaeota archaeon]
MAKSKDCNTLSREEEILLIEYQKSQDSAQHFDGLFWTVTSILLAASFILLGSADKLLLLPEIYQQIIYILGLLLIAVLEFLSFDFTRYTRIKYERCKEIEKHLGMKQHRRTVFVKFPKYLQKHVMNILFILIVGFWSYLLFTTFFESSFDRICYGIIGVLIFIIYMLLCYGFFDLKRQKTENKIWKP